MPDRVQLSEPGLREKVARALHERFGANMDWNREIADVAFEALAAAAPSAPAEEACSDCGGSGAEDHFDDERPSLCPSCHGTGRVRGESRVGEALQEWKDAWTAQGKIHGAEVERLKARAEAAEAERDELRAGIDTLRTAEKRQCNRADEAEDRCNELREAIRDHVNTVMPLDGSAVKYSGVARSAETLWRIAFDLRRSARRRSSRTYPRSSGGQ